MNRIGKETKSPVKVEFKRKNLFKKIVFFFFSAVLLAAIGTGIWFFRNGDFIKINNIEVLGTRMVPVGGVIDLITGAGGHKAGFMGFVLPDDHFFAYKSENEIAKSMISLYPRIKTASIEKKIGERKMVVSISERREKLIWCVDKEGPRNCFWLDEEGFIMSGAPDSKGTLIIVMSDATGREIKEGGTAMSGEKIGRVIDTCNMIADFGWVIDKVTVSDFFLSEASIDISTGQKILISLDRDPITEGKPIIEMIISSGEWPDIDYTDLRIEGKGFYKVN